MKRSGLLLTLTTVSAIISSVASAETLVGSHSGATDPVAQGWIEDLAGTGTFAGGVNDGGTPAWVVTDASTAVGSARWYRWELPPGHLAEALSTGWRVRADLRVANGTGASAGQTQFFGFVTGSVAFQVHLRADSTGVTARLLEGYPPFSGPTYFVAGLGYHTYELASDGVSGTASLSIDGNEVHTGYDGLPFGSSNGARFGCATSEVTGTVYASSVELWLASDAVAVGDHVEPSGWGRIKTLFR